MKVGDFIIFENGTDLEAYLLADRPQDIYNLKIFTGENGLFYTLNYITEKLEEVVDIDIKSFRNVAAYLSGRWISSVTYTESLDEKNGSKFYVYVLSEKVNKVENLGENITFVDNVDEYYFPAPLEIEMEE